MCVWTRRLFTLNRKARQTDTLAERAGEETIFNLLIVVGFFFVLLMHFLLFLDNIGHFWETTGLAGGSCCLSLILHTSTWWTQSSGSWRWGVNTLLFIETVALRFLWKVLWQVSFIAGDSMEKSGMCVLSCGPRCERCLLGESRLWETVTRPLGLEVCQDSARCCEWWMGCRVHCLASGENGKHSDGFCFALKRRFIGEMMQFFANDEEKKTLNI